jgi:hypothetical protein
MSWVSALVILSVQVHGRLACNTVACKQRGAEVAACTGAVQLSEVLLWVRPVA